MKRRRMTFADRVEDLTGTRATKEMGSVPSTAARDEEVTQPCAAYLRHLVRTLIGDTTTPLDILNECDKLTLAIHANDLTAITDCLTCLGRLADAKGFTLPHTCRSCWGTLIWRRPAPIYMRPSSDCGSRCAGTTSRVAHPWQKRRRPTLRLSATTRRQISIHLVNTDSYIEIAPVAQGIEHPPPKRGADSSNLSGRATFPKKSNDFSKRRKFGPRRLTNG